MAIYACGGGGVDVNGWEVTLDDDDDYLDDDDDGTFLPEEFCGKLQTLRSPQDVAESLMQDDLVYSKTQVEYDKKYQEYLKYIAPDNAISTEDEDFSNPNPNPSPLNQSKWPDLTMVIPDMLSERQKRIKHNNVLHRWYSLRDLVCCNEKPWL